MKNDKFDKIFSMRKLIFHIVVIILFASACGQVFSQNMIVNPGFEGSGGWLYTPAFVGLSSTEQHSGVYSAYMYVQGSDTAVLGQCVSGLVAGKTYEFEYWVKADSIRNYFFPFLRFTSDTGNVFDSYFCPNGNVNQWTRMSSRFTPPTGADSIIFYFALFQKGIVWLDDFSLTEITDTTYRSFTVNTQQTANPFTDIFNANGIGPGNLLQPNNHIQKFQETGIRYVRTHDFAIAFDYHIIFPDTSKNPFDSTAYNFHTTDSCIADIISAGGKIYYRFGESYEIYHEHAVPPADKQKFAEVCLQIIKHYNDGWNNGFHYGLDYFEIWNEPDIKEFWTSDANEYIQLYATTAKKIKQYNSSLHVGGPAISNIFNESFINPFLDSVVTENLPLDFLSYHLYYYPNPYYFKVVNEYARTKLQEYGLGNTELINSEWNPYLFSFETYSEWGMDDPLNAASTASALNYMQESTIGKMIRYAFDNYWFGMVDWNDNWRYAGYVFKAYHEMAENTERLETNGADSLGSAIVASRDSSGSIMYVMISDNSSSANGYTLTFAGLGTSAWNYTVYRIDENNLLAPIGNGDVLQSQPAITQSIHSPFVDYIVLQKTTGILNFGNENKFSLFPVPAKDQLWITSETGYSCKLALLEMSGKQIANYSLTNGRACISLLNIPAGIYLAIITDANNIRYVKKFQVLK